MTLSPHYLLANEAPSHGTNADHREDTAKYILQSRTLRDHVCRFMQKQEHVSWFEVYVFCCSQHACGFVLSEKLELVSSADNKRGQMPCRRDLKTVKTENETKFKRIVDRKMTFHLFIDSPHCQLKQQTCCL